MLELKSKLSASAKYFSKDNYSIFTVNLIKLCVIAVFGITLYSCKSNKVVKNKSTNAAIEKIANLTKNNILVCAHRSFHNNAPENSLLSIKKAIEANIDIIEIDVRTTKDSVLVLMHDNDIDRMTNGKGKINQYTYQELQKFNLKSNDSITNEKIPLLLDALKLSKGKVIPNLDLKAVNYNQLHQMLKSVGMEHEVISYIGKKDKIQEMFSIDPYYAILPLSNTIEDITYFISNDNSPLQHFTDESFTKELMDIAIKNKQLVFINTLWDEDKEFAKGDAKRMDDVINLKPAIIQTDYPKLLIDYLQSKNLHD